MAMRVFSSLWNYRRSLILILTPVVFLPIPLLYSSQAGRCLYCIMIMAVFWMTEVIPMAATALLPMVLMPWLGVMDAKKVAIKYLTDANMLFIGGLIIAVAIEKWNLHKRIALRVLLLVGSQPKWLMFGFMGTTAFLSMWISNTATTAMMVPIAQAVLSELAKQRGINLADLQSRNDKPKKQETELVEVTNSVGKIDGQNSKVHPTNCAPETDQQRCSEDGGEVSSSATMMKARDRLKEEKYFVGLVKALTISVAYAANVGGTATLTGTGPNLVIAGQLEELFVGHNVGVNFSSWFVFAFPNMILSLTLTWLWLQFYFLGPRELINWRLNVNKEERLATRAVLKDAHNKLGPMKFPEAAVLVHFIILVLLWLTRKPGFVPGWISLLDDEYVTDACLAITISLSLFITPATPPTFLLRLCRKKAPELEESGKKEEVGWALLDWQIIHKRLSWSIVLMLGGGFALAEACEVSGLSRAIGIGFSALKMLPTWVICLVLSTITAAVTEVTSNVATATIFLPIIAQLSSAIEVNPLYLMLPVTLAASFAFMLPVATPPNAIVFAFGNLKIIDMVKAGVVLNILCILILQLTMNTWAHAYFTLNKFPEWAIKVNLTAD